MPNKKLIVIVGPTAIGKTCTSIALAQKLETEIVSCDSRQCYRELNIGVARPSDEELDSVRHHFVACRSIRQPYNAFTFAEEALQRLNLLFQQHETVVAVGGSGLYIDALCNGINLLPDPSPQLRHQLSRQLQQGGLPQMLQQLQQLDPDTFAVIDRDNPVRVQRAMEVILTSGKPYSLLINRPLPPRPFQIVKIGLLCSRQTLRSRIETRVDSMVSLGLLNEVNRLLPLRHLPTLHTVGYQELFPYFDGKDELTSALTKIKNHTWQYAKKQINWFRRYNDINWIDCEKYFQQNTFFDPQKILNDCLLFCRKGDLAPSGPLVQETGRDF